MKKKVLLRAPLLCQSGYSTHARQIFRWLESHSECDFWVHTVPWGNTSWLLDKNGLNGLVGRIMSKTGIPPKDLDVSIQVQLPNEWDSRLAKYNIGITAAVETDICNPSWIHNVNAMDLVIVPSEHAKSSLVNSGVVTTEVHVIPESFIDEICEPNDTELPKFDTDFNFLLFGQITGQTESTDRKNTYNALKWICEEFKKDKNVGIVIKTNSARNCYFDKYSTKDTLKRVLGQVRGTGDIPPVYFLHGEMTNKEVAALYRHPQIKALVALTRAEGYGLPILEAAASGLPVIATDWSGHLDFMSKGKFLKVDYSIEEIPKAKIDKRKCPNTACKNGNIGQMGLCAICGGTGFTQIFMEGARWAEPKETSAKKVLKKFREMPEKPKEWADDLAIKIREDYSQQAIEKYYDLVLSDVLI